MSLGISKLTREHTQEIWTMKENNESKRHLVSELAELRQRVGELERLEAERKRAEKVLRESQEKLQRIFESAGDGIAITDLRGTIIEANDSLAKIHGFDCKDDIVGKSVPELLPQHEIERAMVSMQKALEQDSVTVEEYSMLKADGSEFPVELNAKVLKDASGNRVGLVSILRDITERKRAEEEIQRAWAELDQIFETAADGMRVVDKDFNVLRVNQTFCDLSGVNREDALDMKCYEVLGGRLCHTPECPLTKIMASAEGVEKEEEMQRADGTTVPCIVTATLFRHPDGKVIGIVEDFKDITERKQAEEELELRARLLDSATDSILVSDLDGNLLYVNEECCRSRGYSKEEMLGMNIKELNALGYAERTKSWIQELMQKGEITIENAHLCKDGSVIPLEARIRVVEVDGKKLLISAARDITERKRREDALRKRVKELTCLYSVNHDLQKGLAIEELCRRIVQYLVPAMQFPEIAVVVIELDGSRYTSKGYTEGLSHGLHSEIRIGKKGFGRLSVYYTKDKPFLIPEEQNLLNTVGEDLGLWIEQQRAEEALKKSEEKYRDLFENASDLIQSIKPDGSFAYVNRAWRETLGYSEGEIPNLSFRDVIHPDSLAHCEEVFQRVLKGEIVLGVTATFVTKGGRPTEVEGNVNCSFEKGIPVASRGIFRDITKRKKMEEELRQTIKMKSEFYSHVSHELRNPLNFILGYAQLLSMEENLNDVQKRFVDNILAGGERLVPLIEDFFELSKLDSGHITLKRESQPLKPLLSLVDQDHRLAAQAKGIQLTFHDEDVVDDEAILDAVKFRQAMDNLVGNAIKYTPKGGKVSVTLTKGANQFAIRIADTGVGIAPKDHGRIFQEFIRVENNESSDKDMIAGTGLGLPIAKRIINLHGGRINLQSELGKGATFTVTIPAGGEDDKNTGR